MVVAKGFCQSVKNAMLGLGFSDDQNAVRRAKGDYMASISHLTSEEQQRYVMNDFDLKFDKEESFVGRNRKILIVIEYLFFICDQRGVTYNNQLIELTEEFILHNGTQL